MLDYIMKTTKPIFRMPAQPQSIVYLILSSMYIFYILWNKNPPYTILIDLSHHLPYFYVLCFALCTYYLVYLRNYSLTLNNIYFESAEVCLVKYCKFLFFLSKYIVPFWEIFNNWKICVKWNS